MNSGITPLKTVIFLALSLSCSLACRPQTFDETLKSLYAYSVPLVSPSEAANKLDKSKVLLLDIRSETEFKVSHIEGAHFVDFNNFDPAEFKNIDKSLPVIVYCTVGYRSERIGEKLIDLGFRDVSNIYGGIFEWKNSDHPVVNLHNIPTDSVHTYDASWSKWLNKGIKVYE